MPIKTPTRVSSGEYLNFRELVQHGPVLALFRVVEFQPGVPSDYNDPKTGRPRNTYPVIADVLICSGPRSGEVHLRETVKFAASNALRGITVAASDAGEVPVNAPGDELPYVVSMISKKGANPFVGLDPAEGKALDQILAVYADGAGWTAAASAGSAPAGTPAAEPEREKVGAAAGAGSPRPWER